MSQREAFPCLLGPREGGGLVLGKGKLDKRLSRARGGRATGRPCSIGQRGERAGPMGSRAGIPKCRLKLFFVALTSPYLSLSCAAPAKEGGTWFHVGPAGETG